jgi:hypothetical protein
VFASVLPPEVRLIEGAIADLDGDRRGELVLVIGAYGLNSSSLRVLHSLGKGRYELGAETYLGGEAPAGLVIFDWDRDGDLDAVCVANYEGYMGVVHVVWNDGAGQLGNKWSRRLIEGRAVDAAPGDFDGDGIQDVAIMSPHYWQSPGEPSRFAFLFGRRDEVSASVPTAEFPLASVPGTSAFAIRQIAPNPARHSFGVHLTLEGKGPARIGLYDTAGRRVREIQIADSRSGEGEVHFDALGDLPAGLYWVRASQGNRVTSKRIALLR